MLPATIFPKADFWVELVASSSEEGGSESSSTTPDGNVRIFLCSYTPSVAWVRKRPPVVPTKTAKRYVRWHVARETGRLKPEYRALQLSGPLPVRRLHKPLWTCYWWHGNVSRIKRNEERARLANHRKKVHEKSKTWKHAGMTVYHVTYLVHRRWLIKY